MTHPLLSGLAAALAQMATDRAGGRQALTELWDVLDPGDAAARCILAHFLADAQDDLDDEIAWDEVSLAESAKVSDDELRAIRADLHVAGFRPEDASYRDLIVTWQQRVAAAIEARDSTSLA
jgi:hypothetical protein